ncbi:MAG: hypothetical protein OEX08_02895 [Candidatus Nomurabacteria bacterium]|nr:hypothetical protein [Candidatus Nomurabacteria bacterium]
MKIIILCGLAVIVVIVIVLVIAKEYRDQRIKRDFLLTKAELIYFLEENLRSSFSENKLKNLNNVICILEYHEKETDIAIGHANIRLIDKILLGLVADIPKETLLNFNLGEEVDKILEAGGEYLSSSPPKADIDEIYTFLADLVELGGTNANNQKLETILSQ